MTIEIKWKKKVHYTRPNYDDPLVQEAVALIAKQWREFGNSLYSISASLPSTLAGDTAGCPACGYRGAVFVVYTCPNCGHATPCA